MGCGKSTVGRILARRLKWKFIDLDEFVERRERLSVAELFEVRGEEGFRRAERRAIRALARRRRSVIAVGGGAPTRAGNRALLKRMGYMVYIRVTPELLARRLAREGGDRPLLRSAGGNPRRLRKLVKAMLRKREPYYRQADACVCGGNRAPGALAGMVLRRAVREAKDCGM